MAAAGDVCASLIRHKAVLLRELCDTNVLDVLVKKGLVSLNDLELITSAADSDKCNYFLEVVSKQCGAKLSEVCSVLEKECPKLAKELMNDKNRFILNGKFLCKYLGILITFLAPEIKKECITVLYC